MTERRTSRTGPGGSRRPGHRPNSRGRGVPGPVGPVEGPAEARPESRITGRAAILILVVAVLAVSYASSMRAYLQQRAHIADVKEQIAERRSNIDALEREKGRWSDEAFVQAQARKRFGYLMPGETGFEVIGEDGRPLEAQGTLHDPDEVIKEVPTPWWTDAWDSMELAGNPPPPKPEPADLVDGTKAKGGSGD